LWIRTFTFGEQAPAEVQVIDVWSPYWKKLFASGEVTLIEQVAGAAMENFPEHDPDVPVASLIQT
jgi:hypothetical protein